ncbi:MAG: hypothetical protein EZS28_006350 [Streblomastix strix]|uniref:Uncharacterized protein n=1 Tax=Streblomastix strix TaxID=222440 RepID=A0A5J4WT57_9EUKA|nr:MAG: hypothetical protein EZS28_006350 [Streblomastix strix]
MIINAGTSGGCGAETDLEIIHDMIDTQNIFRQLTYGEELHKPEQAAQLTLLKGSLEQIEVEGGFEEIEAQFENKGRSERNEDDESQNDDEIEQ